MGVPDIVEKIEQLTVLELNELVKTLEEKFGVSAAAAPIAVASGGGGGGGAAAEVVEKTEFDVVLIGFGDKKIQVIKVVRAITSLGLKEAKELVDGIPSPIKEGVTREEAADIKKQIEEAGGTVEVK